MPGMLAKPKPHHSFPPYKPIGGAPIPCAKNKSGTWGAAKAGMEGVMVMDCAVETEVQQCSLQPPGSASDRCCRVWKSSQDDEPERTREGPELAEPGQSKKFRN